VRDAKTKSDQRVNATERQAAKNGLKKCNHDVFPYSRIENNLLHPSKRLFVIITGLSF
jgi:hypothetical protein